jgi:hypothetical protein
MLPLLLRLAVQQSSIVAVTDVRRYYHAIVGNFLSAWPKVRGDTDLTAASYSASILHCCGGGT